MTSIDEVSKSLGALEAGMEHIKSKVDDIYAKVDTTNGSLIVQEQKIKSAHKRLDVVQPMVEGHEDIKNKGIGIIAVLSIAFSALGAFIGKVLL